MFWIYEANGEAFLFFYLMSNFFIFVWFLKDKRWYEDDDELEMYIAQIINYISLIVSCSFLLRKKKKNLLIPLLYCFSKVYFSVSFEIAKLTTMINV